MQPLRNLAIAVFTLCLAFFTTACGSSSAHVRLLNAFLGQNTAMDLLVDGKSVASAVAYASGSAYVSVSSGSHHLQAQASGSSNIVADFGTQNLASNSYSTAASTDNGPVVFTDDHSAPSSGNIKIRVINASSLLSSGTDVYIVSSGNGISGSPTFSALGYPAASSYTSLAAGSYQAIFTPPGQTFADFISGGQSFSSGQNRTMVIMSGLGGGFTSTVLADLN